MKPLHISIILTVINMVSIKSYATTDTLAVQTNVSLMGSWQTGNLNQLGLTPQLDIKLSNTKFGTNLNFTYSYLEVENFTVLNDFWSNVELRLKPQNKIYPLLAMFYGFAHSYRINHALVAGAGAGWSPIKSTEVKTLELSAFAGYMDFAFETEPAHRTPAMGTIFTFKIPINEKVLFEWSLKTYHSFTDKEYWGANNNVSLAINLVEKLHLKISHNWLYNDKTVPQVEKNNTLMLVGIQYNFKN